MRVVSAPAELVIAPIVNAPSGVTREVVWYPPSSIQPQQELVVEAWDGSGRSASVRRRIGFTVFPPDRYEYRSATPIDLNGDSDLELVAISTCADLPGAIDAGAFARFDPLTALPGSARPPVQLPDVLAASPAASAGSFRSFHLFGDVTGDGLPEVIASHGSSVLVWKGNGGAGAPIYELAELRSNDPNATGAGAVILEDVTNDGIADVLVGFPDADTTAIDAGEVLIFEGGGGMKGVLAPFATLQVPGASAGDRLGNGLRIEDVSGDGLRDVLAGSSNVDVGGIPDVGGVYVWEGGATLTGNAPLLAALQTSGAVLTTRLGEIHLVDVTGDSVKDVVVANSGTPPGGAIFVWQGGPALAGTLDATADLVVSTAVSGDGLASPLRFSDLNRDGVTDLIAAAPVADVGGIVDAGAIYVFAGGALSGTVNETATLRLAAPSRRDELSLRGGLQLVDVTGDGAADVIAGSPNVNAGEGAIHVWGASPGIAGIVFPTATLDPPDGTVMLTAYRPPGSHTVEIDGMYLTVADVTGDQVPDVLGSAQHSFSWEGAVFLWVGGSALAAGGVVPPTVQLSDDSHQTWLLGGGEGGAGVRAVDFNGDGVLDVVSCSHYIGISGPPSFAPYVADSRVLVWLGGRRLAAGPPAGGTAGTPTRLIADTVLETLGWAGFTARGSSYDFTDLTGDGFLDLVGSDPNRWNSTGTGTGVIAVFAGGPAAIGNSRSFKISRTAADALRA